MIAEALIKDETLFEKGIKVRFSDGLNLVFGVRAIPLFNAIKDIFFENISSSLIAKLNLNGFEIICSKGKVFFKGENSRVLKEIVKGSVLFEESDDNDIEKDFTKAFWAEEEMEKIKISEGSSEMLINLKNEIEMLNVKKEELKEFEEAKSLLSEELKSKEKYEELEPQINAIQVVENIYLSEKEKIEEDIKNFKKKLKEYSKISFWKTPTFFVGLVFSFVSLVGAAVKAWEYYDIFQVVLPGFFSLGVIMFLVSFFLHLRGYEKTSKVEDEIYQKSTKAKFLEDSLSFIKGSVMNKLPAGMRYEDVRKKLKMLRESESEMEKIISKIREIKKQLESKNESEIREKIRELEELTTESKISGEQKYKVKEKINEILSVKSNFLETVYRKLVKSFGETNKENVYQSFKNLLTFKNVKFIGDDVWISNNKIGDDNTPYELDKIVSNLLLSSFLREKFDNVFFIVTSDKLKSIEEFDIAKFLSALSSKNQVIVFSENFENFGMKPEKIFRI